jgi:non-specific serine/threonine protein kinase
LHGGPLLTLGGVALARGDSETAQRLLDESIEVHRRAGEKWGLGILLAHAAALRVTRGNVDQAAQQASEALTLCEELEDPRGTAWALDVLASVLVAAGRCEDAARLCGASDVLQEMVGAPLPPDLGLVRKSYLERIGASLDPAACARARDEGRAMSVGQAAELVRKARTAPP